MRIIWEGFDDLSCQSRIQGPRHLAPCPCALSFALVLAAKSMYCCRPKVDYAGKICESGQIFLKNSWIRASQSPLIYQIILKLIRVYFNKSCNNTLKTAQKKFTMAAV